VILQEIAAEFPGQVRLLLAEKNYGDFGLSNFMSTIDNCRGEYVALLDGDDYWTSTAKLQRQVDFLDAHPECDLCVHRVEHVSDDGFANLSPLPAGAQGTQSVHDIGTLLVENYAEKVSTVVRRSAVDAVPDWFRNTRVASADWVFNVLAGRNGKVGFINEVMAVHRRRSTNLTSYYGASRMLRDKLEVLEVLRPYFPAHKASLRQAARRIRWKLLIARLGPASYEFVRRLRVGRIRK
jgi:glycosyltransferase involved in cell wall biosynthesis